MPLKTYRQKRDFRKTAEPAGSKSPRRSGNSYFIQKHDASRLHYDFRLELDGVLLSWAVPKGPSLNPGDKRLAVHVEDHPIEYGTFEGTIPKGQYGGGTVMLWDRGTWEPLEDPRVGIKKGRLKFLLHGERLQGGWTLVRMGQPDKGDNWLLIKEKDEAASADESPIEQHTGSVATGRSLAQIAGVAEPAAARRKRASKIQTTAGKAAPFPEAVEPQLASLVSTPPAGADWLHELKFDGYRLFIFVQNGRATVWTARGRQDWTHRFRTLAKTAEKLIRADAILDGEAVVLRPDGSSDFQALQNSLKGGSDAHIVFCAFDLLYLNGRDLRGAPLEDRKSALEKLLARAPAEGPIRLSKYIDGNGDEVFAQCCKLGMEGIISKRAGSPYLPVRNRNWVKVKCTKRQELVIGGYTTPRGSRSHFGAILLGHFDDKGKLHYAGRVGTGFDEATLGAMIKKFEKLARPKPAFVNPPRGADAKGVTWLEPKLVAEIAFAQWTNEGIVRQGAFLGLRDDKPAREVKLERAQSAPANGKAAASERPVKTAAIRTSKKSSPPIEGITLSHPERLLFPKSGVSKQDLADYYQAVGDWMLPYVAGRPLALVRCPDGKDSQCFFQKHLSQGMGKFIMTRPLPGKNDVAIYLEKLGGLIELVQFSTLEIHAWGCHVDKIEKPDLLIFDLDPDVETPWQNVIDGAVSIRRVLEAIDIQSFAKTSGGKGLHVYAPLQRRGSWDDLKSFARQIAVAMEKADPSRYLSVASKARRRGKIFVDYLRNGQGATCVVPYSSRARDLATVSVPVSWEEVEAGVRPDAFQLKDVLRRLEKMRRDPWKDFHSVRQTLTEAKKRSLKLE